MSVVDAAVDADAVAVVDADAAVRQDTGLLLHRRVDFEYNDYPY